MLASVLTVEAVVEGGRWSAPLPVAPDLVSYSGDEEVAITVVVGIVVCVASMVDMFLGVAILVRQKEG
jgi:hypothetical protein